MVRERGYATAVDELEQGLTAVAAPVFGIDGHVVASVSASGPSFRLPAERLPEVAAAVVRGGAADLPPASAGTASRPTPSRSLVTVASACDLSAQAAQRVGSAP